MVETPSSLETLSDLSGAKALAHGLGILSQLVGETRSLTATEIARRVGLHQSQVSRILKTLIHAGYVRKPDYHSFAMDYGVLALGGRALGHFPLLSKPRGAVQELAAKCPGMSVSLAAFWRDTVIYLLRAQQGHDLVLVSSAGYPLHLSSPALRWLVEWPESEALRALEASRARHGWERPAAKVPESAEAVLRAARGLIRHDCLVLEGWQGQGRMSVAIPVEAPGEPQAALAIAGPSSALQVDEALLLLQAGRRAVEALLR